MYGFHFCLTFQVDLSFKQTKVVELDLYLYFDLRVLARILKKSAEIPAWAGVEQCGKNESDFLAHFNTCGGRVCAAPPNTKEQHMKPFT